MCVAAGLVGLLGSAVLPGACTGRPIGAGGRQVDAGRLLCGAGAGWLYLCSPSLRPPALLAGVFAALVLVGRRVVCGPGEGSSLPNARIRQARCFQVGFALLSC